MDVHSKSDRRGSSLNPQYVLGSRPFKAMRFSLRDSGISQAGNFSVAQASMTCEWTGRTPKINHKSSPISSLSSLDVGSDGLLHSVQSPECYNNNRNQTSDVSVWSSLNTDGSSKAKGSFNENIPYFNGHSFHGSPSIRSCLSGGSPTSSQTSQTYSCSSQHSHLLEDSCCPAISGYSENHQPADLKHMLEELETSLMGPDSDDPNNFEAIYEGHRLSGNSEWSLETLSNINDLFCQSSEPLYPKTVKGGISRAKEKQQQLIDHPGQSLKIKKVNGVELEKEFQPSKSALMVQNQVQVFESPQGDVRQPLIACAKAIAESDLVEAEKLIAELRLRVSICGDPIQRLGAYMLEGLVARLASSGGTIYKSLKCKEPARAEFLSYMQVLYQVCPYFKFGYVAANGAIAEALKDEDRIHIIDFQIAQGNQWITLIQALATRRGSPPHVRITGMDDPVSENARAGGLQLVSQTLSKLAETCKVPFEFHALPMFGSDVHANMLDVRSGEALAVNFPFQLHRMPDESVSTSNHRDRLLRMVKGLAPKVVTLVEQESNTNTAPFFSRFMEALSYYSAVFESLDVTFSRDSKDRVRVEQHCLARDIVNIIACEGAERVERHEVLGKWRSRLTMAGFKPYPLSSYVNSTIKSLLERYCENYTLIEKDNTVYLGWLNRPLIVASAWQ